jgi:hypothetical protein
MELHHGSNENSNESAETSPEHEAPRRLSRNHRHFSPGQLSILSRTEFDSLASKLLIAIINGFR